MRGKLNFSGDFHSHICWWSTNGNEIECVDLTYTARSYLWVVAFAWNLLLVMIWSPGWESPLEETAACGNTEWRSNLGLCVTENPCSSHSCLSLEISTRSFLPCGWFDLFSNGFPSTRHYCMPSWRESGEENSQLTPPPSQSSVHRRPTVRWGSTCSRDRSKDDWHTGAKSAWFPEHWNPNKILWS